MMKKIIFFLTACLVSGLGAVLQAADAAPRSFAVVVDPGTYSACRDEIALYEQSVEMQGLHTLTLVSDWKTPEEVKAALTGAYRSQGLEGAVFVGKIPVPMIRRAQHFCSAFKMAEDPDDMFNTSVPSDRFYDDFDLKFDFISAQDTLGASYFYYNLRGDGAQEIASDIYTARIKPTLDGEAGYRQLSAYFRKLVSIKAETNPADHIMSYTGEGSFSNSLVAWKDEAITLEEQFPGAFRRADGVRFYIYAMYPFPKDVLKKELSRKDLDVALFHEHGVPERQYVSANPPVSTTGDYYTDARRNIRSNIATQLRYGHPEEETIENLKRQYDLDDSWFSDLHDPAIHTADSLYDLKTGIILADIHEWNPNPLVTIFDACYNGDFREKDCVASSFIFGSGRSVVSLGNTVNVLQDKSSSDMLGLLSAGYNIGQYAVMINILESHIIGDPTFRFTPSDAAGLKPDFSNADTTYWRAVLDGDWTDDVRALALYKLYYLGYEGLSDLLYETYCKSDSYMLRLQTMHLCSHFLDGNYKKLLLKALDDPYEFIRRKAVYYAGFTGDPVFVEPVARMYMYDRTSKRVCFNIISAAGFWGPDAVPSALSEIIDKSDDIFDKENFKKENLEAVNKGMYMSKSIVEAFSSKEHLLKNKFYISALRNMPYTFLSDQIASFTADQTLPLDIRVQLAEAMGWYVRSDARPQLVKACKDILSSQSGSLDARLADELTKTIGRLEAYMK